MATYPQQLTIEDGSKVYKCNIYTTAEEATPDGGRALMVGVNYGADIGYIGIIPTNIAPSDSPTLKLQIEGIDYFFLESVTVYVTLTINPSEHQTINFICNGILDTITTSTGPKCYILPVGSPYSISVVPEENYNAGTIVGIANSGFISLSMKNISVTVSEASVIVPEKVLVTVTQPTGATIYVTCNGEIHTDSFEAQGNDVLTFSMSYSEGYSGGSITVNGSLAPSSLIVTEDVVVNAINLIVKAYTVNLEKGEHIASVVMTVNGEEIQSGSFVKHGSELVVTAVAEEGCAEPTITFS